MRGPWARSAASLLLALAAPGLAPFSAAAQVVSRSAGAAAASSARVAVAPVLTTLAPLPTLAPSPLSVPTLAALPTAAPILAAPILAAAPAAALPLRASPAVTLGSAAAEVERVAPSFGRIPTESASAAGETQFRLLIGEALSAPTTLAAAEGPAAPRPTGLTPAPKEQPPLDPVRRRGVRGMIAGTAAMKLGMETVTLSVPMLVLSGMGGAALVATLMVGYGVAQAVFSGAAGGLIDRSSPQKVLAVAVAAQAVLTGSIVVLGALGLLSVPLLATGYVLIGGAAGIMETARQSIPARLLGQDAEELSRYNARLHIFYETAGVVGPLAAGALMAAFGPLWALVLNPPAYLAAAWLFARVRLPAGPAKEPTVRAGSVADRVKEYAADVKAGARVVLGDPRLRWIGLAFVVPQVLHRVLEGLILPVFAKRVLGAPGDAAYLLTASNLGELIGAALLLKFADKIPAPAWVRRGAAALAVLTTLALTHSLWLALPAVLLMSATWSSSDLALRSDIQARLGEHDLPRATAFLYGVFVLGAAAASLGLGFLFDALAPSAALGWTAAAFVAAGAAVLLAARRLRAKTP